MGDDIIEDKVQIRDEILRYYLELYEEAEPWRPSTVFEELSTLNAEESEDVESPFDEVEVLAALNPCAPDKAPGPVGYTMFFFSKSMSS